MATAHRIVSRDAWLEERRELLEQEKRLTRLHDQLSEKRRALPWVEVREPYVFEGPSGEQTLVDLFEGRSQLVVYHFMFAPEWEAGCKSCSFWGDSFGRIVPHLNARDVTFAAVSRAPYAKLRAYARRLGFTFPWVSSNENGFNAAFGVYFTPEAVAKGEASYNYGSMEAPLSDMHGISVFVRDGTKVYHTYSTYGRGVEAVNAAYAILDMTPKGRDESGLSNPMAWVRRNDEYAA